MKGRPLFPTRGEGIHSRQAHADLPEGTYEREMSSEGFFGPASHLYHARPPTAWTHIEGPLMPRAFCLAQLRTPESIPWCAPQVVHNGRVSLRFWMLDRTMNALARNADGDQLLFVHRGAGHLFCDFGHMPFEAGDYLVVPRGCMWRLQTEEECQFLMVEATGSRFRLPDRGPLGAHAIFDPAVLQVPRVNKAFEDQRNQDDWVVHVKRDNAVTRVHYAHNPLDVVGWHGDLAPVRLNLRDVRPIMSHRYHVPPSAHGTFVSNGFVVCSFVPRPFETDPGALKVPFFHNNDDYDEVLFYHAGDFFSRDHVEPGMLTFHPSGLTHGPHPGALKHMLDQPRDATDEYAVMVDSREPLFVDDAVNPVEWVDYVRSWEDNHR